MDADALADAQKISIHAPREGSDAERARPSRRARLHFNPRSPRGERHAVRRRGTDGAGISIHAPREGSDTPQEVIEHGDENFNPRSPRGERRSVWGSLRHRWRFQSTLPARGATVSLGFAPSSLAISIHAPREGSDTETRAPKTKGEYFNPRSPRGERHRYQLR